MSISCPEGGVPGPAEDETVRPPPRDAVAPAENGKRAQGGQQRHRGLRAVLSPCAVCFSQAALRAFPRPSNPRAILADPRPGIPVFQADGQ